MTTEAILDVIVATAFFAAYVVSLVDKSISTLTVLYRAVVLGMLYMIWAFSR